ncbi:MAG TPA: AMIN domain-containing protein, partial [Anaeromyxobacteraceae bacterium]|nr:AMIN domain-containing protein [Anaeromyxobacteraceae bacterium]
MRLLVLAVTSFIAAPTLAQGPALNLVTKVEVKDQGGAVAVTIQGSRPPSFTTFSMVDPPRFVIDISEAAFKGVPEDLPVGDDVVNVVKNLSYGSDVTSIARVMIAFQRDVEPPEVQTSGNALVVKIAKGPGAAVAQAEPARPQAPAAPAAAPAA